MLKLILVGIGGGLGSVIRYLLGQWIGPYSPNFPTATLIINVTGCLAIGFLFVALKAWKVSEEYEFAILVGVLGGYTTFSTFGRETMTLIELNRYGAAAVNVVLSNGLGIAGVFLGKWCAERWIAA